MQTLFKAITAALAFAGCLSLLITGELNPVFVMPAIAIVPGYWRYLTGQPPVSRWLVAGLALVEIGVMAFDMAYVTGDFLIVVAHMTIIFQALKSFDFRDPWDPLQVYFMSLLQLIITSELSLSIWVGAFFVGFLFIFMAALVIAHFMKSGTVGEVRLGRPVLIVGTLALVLTLVFFVTVPRTQGGLWGRKASDSVQSVGFSDNVSFGTFGKLLEDDTIVMRIAIRGEHPPLYWRGNVLDHFDGLKWSSTNTYRIRVNRDKDDMFHVRDAPEGAVLVEQDVTAEPMDTDVVFGLGEIASVEAKVYFAYRNMSGAIFIPNKKDRKFKYKVFSFETDGGTEIRGSFLSKYLQLPDGMRRISTLAADVAGGSTDAGAISSDMERYLRDNYKYSLVTEQSDPAASPIEDFLFNTKKGYCEHYATSMALMLRSLGVPARVITGFAGGDVDEDSGFVLLRQRHAHAWVEAAVGGVWKRYDPTPPAPARVPSRISRFIEQVRLKWYRYVIGYDSYDQRWLIGNIYTPVIDLPEVGGIQLAIRPVHVAALLVTIAVLWFVHMMRGLLREKIAPESRVYGDLRERLARRGAALDMHSTPAEVQAEALRLELDELLVRRLIRTYEAARFGGRELAPSDFRQMRADARTLAKKAKR